MNICPVCGRQSKWLIEMSYIDKLEWLKCSCGCVWQLGDNLTGVIGEKYIELEKVHKFYEESQKYIADVYIPIIEESTFGRKMIEFSDLDLLFSEECARRGWVCYSFDKKSDTVKKIEEPFLETKFDADIKADFIYFYHTLEKKINFKEYLSKSFDALNSKGLIFIATPDTSFIETDGPMSFNHWHKENIILFNRNMLCKELEKVGFNVVLCRKNESSRFPKNNDMHIIAQKGE